MGSSIFHFRTVNLDNEQEPMFPGTDTEPRSRWRIGVENDTMVCDAVARRNLAGIVRIEHGLFAIASDGC